MSTTEKRLQELREEWKRYPQRRESIELQARILKSGVSAPEFIPQKPRIPSLEQLVIKHLF